MLKKLFLILLLLTAISHLQPPSIHAQTPNDVTSKIENLGNPTKARWPDTTNCKYARNVWDMQFFNNKLYLGSGNAANEGPCTNAGPTYLWYFNPLNSQFSTDTSLNSNCGANCMDEEQFDIFKVISGKLYVPSRDPQEGWDWGNIYSTDATSVWRKYRTLPNAVHAYEVAKFDGKLFASIASQDSSANGSSVFMSTDDALTWVKASFPHVSPPRSFFELNGKFYAPISFAKNGIFNYDGLYVYTSPATFTLITNTKQDLIFPGHSFRLDNSAIIFRPTNFQNKLVYIGAEYTTNGSQMEPNGLYKISTITATGTDAAKITLPGSALAMDISVGQNNKLYVLGSIKNGSRFWITVSSTSDLTNWTEEFRFDSPTFARSFEQTGGDFYFGLGTDTTTLSASTGDILRYKATPPSPSPAASTKPGNTDSDSDVDIFDHNTLLTNFGKPGGVPQGDTNNTNLIEIFDYNNLLGNFGK